MIFRYILLLLLLAALSIPSLARTHKYDFSSTPSLKNDNLTSHLSIPPELKNIFPKKTYSKDNEDISSNICEDNDKKIDLYFDNNLSISTLEDQTDDYLNFAFPDHAKNSLQILNLILLI